MMKYVQLLYFTVTKLSNALIMGDIEFLYILYHAT